MSTQAVLKIFKDGAPVDEKVIDGEILLGRSAECGVVLDDRKISRHHVSFKLIEGGKSAQVEKRSDFAPVEMNGVDVTTAIVREGDIVVVGPYELRFHAASPNGALSSPKVGAIAPPAAPPKNKGFEPEREKTLAIPISDVAPTLGEDEFMPLDGVPNGGEFGGDAIVATAPAEGDPGSSLLGDLGSIALESTSAPPKTSDELDLGPSGDSEKSGIDLAPSAPSSNPYENDLGLDNLDALPSPNKAPTESPGEAEVPDLKFGDQGDEVEGPSEVQVDVGDDGEIKQGEVSRENSFSSKSISNAVKTSSYVTNATGNASLNTQARTRVGSVPRIKATLSLAPGAANVSSLEINKDEISIGRGKNCDIVLTDKKSSRKHTVIRKQGVNFLVVDLQSANGTYLNGVKIQEQSLSGDDVIKIGDTEIQFRVMSLDYEEKKNDFLSIPSESTPSGAQSDNVRGSLKLDNMPPSSNGRTNPLQSYVAGGALASQNLSRTQPGISMAGMSGLPSARRKTTLKDRFNELSTIGKAMVVILAAMFVLWFLEEEPSVQPNSGGPKRDIAAKKPGGPNVARTFEKLSPEEKNIVKKSFEAAKVHYKAFNYDQSLFEIRKIFNYVDDYVEDGDSARDLEQYSMEGKRRLDANAEDKKRKEDEENRKKRLAELETDIEALMESKDYEQAKALFSDVVALDPENAKVERWKQMIEEFYDIKRQEEINKQRQTEINDNARTILVQAQELKKEGKCLAALDKAYSIRALVVSDKKILRSTTAIVTDCKQDIETRLGPLLAEAKTAEDSGDVVVAYKQYKKATEVDPKDKRGFQGMERIRSRLHEKAKVAYTEAVIAESYSDFEMAKKKYLECLDIAPQGDIYLERAKRKLARYDNFETGLRGPSSAEPAMEPAVEPEPSGDGP